MKAVRSHDEIQGAYRAQIDWAERSVLKTIESIRDNPDPSALQLILQARRCRRQLANYARLVDRRLEAEIRLYNQTYSKPRESWMLNNQVSIALTLRRTAIHYPAHRANKAIEAAQTRTFRRHKGIVRWALREYIKIEAVRVSRMMP